MPTSHRQGHHRIILPVRPHDVVAVRLRSGRTEPMGKRPCTSTKMGVSKVQAKVVSPTGLERTFGGDEIIVTKTDLKGRITYANDVFLRVSAYTEGQALGQPHSIIRHPDMPRCVFQLLWDTIQARQEIFAYVLNLAGDGAHYWVLAHVTPSLGAGGQVVGYHSSRRVPTKRAVDEIRPIYALLRATESQRPRPVDALAASMAQMGEFLAGRGLTYDQFVWSLAGVSAQS